MINVLIAIHVLSTIAIIGLVLIQHGKGADAGAAFGGGGGGVSGSLFGSQGSANFLSRTTAIIATVFFLTSLSLTYLYSHTSKPKSVTESVLEAPVETLPSEEMPTLPAVPVDEPATAPVDDVPAAPMSSENANGDSSEGDVPVAPAGQTPAKE